MNSALAIVAALLIIVALVAADIKRSIDVKKHWDHFDWGG